MNRLSNSRDTAVGRPGSIGSQSEAARFRPLCIDGAQGGEGLAPRRSLRLQGGSLRPPESAFAFSGV